MPEIALEGLSKRFGATQALADFSLTVADGEFVVLLGPTGAGKTTLLRLIAGLERPDRGRVTIGGTDVTRAQPAQRNVAFVFQQYSLYPHYTVFDNLAFPLRSPLHRLPEREVSERVRQVAGLLGMGEKLANRATRLSGGEMQRVAIGRALVRRPAVYLMDEPLSSLDAKLRADLRVEIKRIQVDLGATIIYVTHDQMEAMTLADRIGVLSQGRLVQIATPREIYSEPADTYVACRLGSPRINLLPAALFPDIEAPAGTATVGVRPEDVMLNGRGPVGHVSLVEALGAETVVEIDLAGQEVRALLAPGDRLHSGDGVHLAPRAGSALFFDAQGNRIGSRSATVP
jgi:multiple sugar transport system ATP-binding protein